MLVPLLDADPHSLGGKGAALYRLATHGLPVPRTWVLPVSVFRAALAEHGPDHLRDAVLPLSSAGLPPLLAVRSSATDEDGRHASAAGQYESVLGVTPDEVADAIRRVWASYFSPHAKRYRTADGGGMAVLVQDLVDARAAGVLFTVNPLTGSWREMTVEAVWGVGEALVAGTIVPDRYLVHRPRRTPRPIQRVLSRVPLRVAEEHIEPQTTERARLADGLGERPVEAPYARKLVRDDILTLCRLGLRAESLLGGPQDVEWAWDRAGQLWILQSRPITHRARLPRGGAPLWTRRFLGERFPDGASPLGWSLVSRVLEWFIAWPETNRRYLGGEPPLRLVRGHPYVNVTVFRHLAFKFPGAPPPRFMLDFFPPDEVRTWVQRPAAPPDLAVYASIFHTTFVEQRWRRFRWNPLTNWQVWDQFVDQLPDRLHTLSQVPPARAPALIEGLLREYVKIHLTSLLFANLAYELVGPLLDPAQQELLLRAPSGTITRRVNRELAELATRPEQLPSFLAAHGHRARASWDIASPRWIDDPDAVLRLATLADGRPEPSPEASEATTRAAMAHLAPPLRSAVRLTQAYLRLREEQRYHLDRLMMAGWQRLRLLATNWFDDPRDVRFLTFDELDGRLGVTELRRTVRRRAAEPVDPHPPDFLSGDEALPPPVAGRRLQGLGISPGVVRGRVRVLHRPEDADHLDAHTILVARSTDPTWTPLFAQVGGLVLELGGLLSHGAVVAREYHLPGVVNVSGATSLLTDQTEVTIDGRSGVVWIHS